MPSTKTYGDHGADEADNSASGRIRKKFLGNDKGKTTFANVRKCFEALRGAKGGNDILQFAKLFFVESVLLPKDKGTGVDMSHLHLLDSVDKFNAYPWGWESYLLTIRHLKAAMEGQPARFLEKKAANPKMKTSKFSFYGFPFVLQVWAYEQFAQLKGVVAVFDEDKVGCPMLKWGSDKCPQYNQLKELIFGEQEGDTSKKLEYAIERLVSEVAHMREVVYNKFGDFEVRMETLSKKVDVLLKKEKKRTRTNKEETCLDEEEEDVADSENEEEEMVGHSEDEEEENEEVGDTEAEEEEEKEEDDEIEVDNNEDEEELEENGEMNCENIENEVEVDKEEEATQKPSRVEEGGDALEHEENELPMSSLPGGTPMQLYEDRLIDTQDYARQVLSPRPVEYVYEQAVPRETRVRKKSRFCLSPYINPTMAMKVKVHPNPLAIQVSPSEWEQFKSWVEEDEDVHPKKLKLKSQLVHEVDRRFFRILLANESWLSSDHLQSVVDLLMSGAGLIGVQRRCLYGPMFTFHLIQKAPSDHAWLRDKTLRKLDWTQMDKVLMTIHAKARHWVLAEVDFPNATVWVYDSLQSAQSISFVRPVVERLPTLLRTVKTTDHQRSIQEWRLELANNVPQQSDAYACGVMILAFAEYLLVGLPLMPDCTYHHVDDFRRQYAARIFRMRAE